MGGSAAAAKQGKQTQTSKKGGSGLGDCSEVQHVTAEVRSGGGERVPLAGSGVPDADADIGMGRSVGTVPEKDGRVDGDRQSDGGEDVEQAIRPRSHFPGK